MWRRGRFGAFIACSNYPACKYIKKKQAREIGMGCPDCGRAYLLEKETKKEGRIVFCGNEACHYRRAA